MSLNRLNECISLKGQAENTLFLYNYTVRDSPRPSRNIKKHSDMRI